MSMVHLCSSCKIIYKKLVNDEYNQLDDVSHGDCYFHTLAMRDKYGVLDMTGQLCMDGSIESDQRECFRSMKKAIDFYALAFASSVIREQSALYISRFMNRREDDNKRQANKELMIASFVRAKLNRLLTDAHENKLGMQ